MLLLMQPRIWLTWLEHTLPRHVEFLSKQHPQVLLLTAALMRFVQAHLSRLPRSLWTASLPLSVLTAPHNWCVNLLRVHSLPLSMLPIKMLDSADPNRWSLRNTTPHWSQFERQAIDCSSLSVTIQPIPDPPSGPFVKSMSLQFRNKDVVWDRVQCFAQSR